MPVAATDGGRAREAIAVALDVEDEHAALQVAERASNDQLAVEGLVARVALDDDLDCATADPTRDDVDAADDADAARGRDLGEVELLLPTKVAGRFLGSRAPRPVAAGAERQEVAQALVGDAGGEALQLLHDAAVT